MNEYAQAVLLGIVEGLTEFLPVSSTAHIRIAQKFLGQDVESEYWKMFAVVIQLGAILSVIIYFRQRLWKFVRSFPQGETGADQEIADEKGSGRWYRHPLALVMISFIVTALPCFLIDNQIGELLEKIDFMAYALIVGGIAMWAIDAWCASRAKTESMDKITLVQAIAIGASQILAAAFPGTSRSMSTIAGGQIMGLSRSAALEFSFFLSIPVMVAATGYKLLKFLKNSPEGMGSHEWSVLAVGFVVSFLVALAVIAWFMRWVRTRGFVPFAIYRIVAGIALLWILRNSAS